jgi:tetratricopeptide (TPR) repeat protein
MVKRRPTSAAPLLLPLHGHGWAAGVGLALLLVGCEPEVETETPEPTPPALECSGAEALTEVWPPERRARLEAALGELPGEWPEQALATIDARVAAEGETWRRTYLQACEADDRRAQRCLDAQLWELDAAIALSLEQPARAVSLWAELAAALADPEDCVGLDEPSFDAPPLEPAVGRELAAMRLRLNIPDYAGASESVAALELVDEVRETPAYALPVAATKALVEQAAGRTSEAAAALSHATELAAELGPRAQMSLAQARAFLAFGRKDLEGGVLALGEALAAAREQGDPWLVFSSLRNLGRVHVQLGNYAAALAPLTEAVSLSARLAGPENPHTAEVQVSLADAQLGLGEVEAALDLLTQARDSFANTLGPDHPQTLASVEAIAALFLSAGQPGDAHFALLDLLEVYGELYGPKDWHTAKVKLELGDTLMAMDQHEGARKMYAEALTPLVEELGADHRAAIRASIHLGIAEFALGKLDEAETHCTRGTKLVKALAPEDPLVEEAAECVERLAKARKRKRR